MTDNLHIVNFFAWKNFETERCSWGKEKKTFGGIFLEMYD